MAEENGTSPSNLAQDIISAHIARQEEYAEDERRWQRYKETGEHLTHEEFRAELHKLANEARELAEKQEAELV